MTTKQPPAPSETPLLTNIFTLKKRLVNYKFKASNNFRKSIII